MGRRPRACGPLALAASRWSSSTSWPSSCSRAGGLASWQRSASRPRHSRSTTHRRLASTHLPSLSLPSTCSPSIGPGNEAGTGTGWPTPVRLRWSCTRAIFQLRCSCRPRASLCSRPVHTDGSVAVDNGKPCGKLSSRQGHAPERCCWPWRSSLHGSYTRPCRNSAARTQSRYSPHWMPSR